MCNQKPELNQKPDKNAPIGVFDSGVGGLTVAREIMRQMPEERIVYFGDTARVPYGSKSQDTIIRYSRQIIRFLMTKHVKAIVIACNTASAYALATVEKEFDVPIIRRDPRRSRRTAVPGNEEWQDRRHCHGRHHRKRYLHPGDKEKLGRISRLRESPVPVCAAGRRGAAS